jgi:DNA polymerase-3 subunit alpha
VSPLAADVWSYWSLGRSLWPPEAIPSAARQHGYDAVLLADWQSLAGAVGFVRAARAEGIRPLVGVTVPVTAEGRRWSVRAVARGPESWGALCRLASDPPMGDVRDVASRLAWIWPESALAVPRPPWRDPAWAGAWHGVLVSRPVPGVPPDVVPVAALPVRAREPGDGPALELLARLIGERAEPASGWVSADTVVERFGPHHPALAGWAELVAACGEDPIPFSPPRLPPWAGRTAEEALSALKRRARQGLKRRGLDDDDRYRRRLADELQVIGRLGYAAYFLIVADLVDHLRAEGIRVGPGRGSAAASLVAYALGITAVDPLKWGLVFERFLNPERADLPDIDLDLEDWRRGEAVRWLREQYGADRVAQIGTWGSLGARAAIREVGRLTGQDPVAVEQAARWFADGRPLAAARSEDSPPWLRRLAEMPWWALAERLEGVPRHASIHAAGVVIAPGPLVERTPVAVAEGQAVTRLGMADLEALGLVKFDLLGLRTLTVVERTRAYGPASLPEVADVPPDDAPTLVLLRHGETDGLFQLESRGMRELLRRLAPRNLADVVTAVALFRPGPMEQVGLYLDRRAEGWTPVDAVDHVLADTYGIAVFQEQVMALARALAGYRWGEADLLRRAMTKKDPRLLAAERERFLARAVARGMDPAVAGETFDRMAAFAEYGFNQAHAVAYGLLAYYTAYLRVHAPEAFWSAHAAVAGHGERLWAALTGALRDGVGVLRPHVNHSDVHAVPEGGAVRVGLDGIRGLGAWAEAIVAARGDRPFFDLADLLRRLRRRPDAGVMSQLRAAGALEGLAGADEVGAERQLVWFSGESRQEGRTDDQAAFGWPWPEPDGHVYIRVRRFGPKEEAALRAVAARCPGPDRLVVALEGRNRGMRLDVGIRSGPASFRALRALDEVVAVVRGIKRVGAATKVGEATWSDTN